MIIANGSGDSFERNHQAPHARAIRESELMIELEPWAHHIVVDWIARLGASLSTIQQTVWERTPHVVAHAERKAQVSLDGYALDVADANEHAEILLRRHTSFAGLI
jgi:hypothetical protein